MAKKQSFLHGTVILALGTIAVKIIGALFKIPLANIIGEEGSGYFNVAYSIYNVLLVISTAGLPVAVSKMVAESNARGRGREIQNILRVALKLFVGIGVAGTLLMFVF
ncbi:oligosaccharide flippase family protein, partial [Oscillospiraceae bacterium OttesenSCG-928-F05]|nr:oligosaccharide flippase family protein [Oscillospiraceae bacterium OttesenSCG-928-F05]